MNRSKMIRPGETIQPGMYGRREHIEAMDASIVGKTEQGNEIIETFAQEKSGIDTNTTGEHRKEFDTQNHNVRWRNMNVDPPNARVGRRIGFRKIDPVELKQDVRVAKESDRTRRQLSGLDRVRNWLRK